MLLSTDGLHAVSEVRIDQSPGWSGGGGNWLVWELFFVCLFLICFLNTDVMWEILISTMRLYLHNLFVKHSVW